MTRKVDRVYRSVHTADGHSIITTPPSLPPSPAISLVCRIAVAVLSIAILSCVPSYSQPGDTIPLRGTDEERRIQSTWRKNISCNCPYNLKSNKHRCGASSAWSRRDGHSPLCYVEELESSNKSLPPKKDEAKKLEGEGKYSSSWCKANDGNDSVTLWDDTKPDCVLPDRVIEFDFGKDMKPYECVGQAIHYARMTGTKPECILIQRSDISDETFQRAVRKAQSAVISCGISLRCMNHEGAIVSCPSAMRSGDGK